MRIRELLERRSADLYHTTSVSNAESILKAGFIRPHAEYGHENDPKGPAISLTRDNQYALRGGVKLVIDQEKLSNTHKIVPYFWDGEQYVGSQGIQYHREEAEERVYNPIPVKYIKDIIINDSVSDNAAQFILELADKLNISVTKGKLTGRIRKRNPIKAKDDAIVVVTDPGLTWLQTGEKLNQQEYEKAIEDFGDTFKVRKI
jgi:hypothetical protein|tara:strand:- start:4 stop:612 length:609 start_codon:yes stop_codon:yes gene_type:complete